MAGIVCILRCIADLKGYRLTGCNGDGLRLLGADPEAADSALLRYIRAQIELLLRSVSDKHPDRGLMISAPTLTGNDGTLKDQYKRSPGQAPAKGPYVPDEDIPPHLFVKPGLGQIPLDDLHRREPSAVDPVSPLELIPLYLHLREYLPTQHNSHHTHLIRFEGYSGDTRLNDILPDLYSPMHPRTDGLFGCASCDPSMSIMNSIRCELECYPDDRIGTATVDKIVEHWTTRVWRYSNIQHVLTDIIGRVDGEPNTKRLKKLWERWWKNDGRFDVPPPEKELVDRAKAVLSQLQLPAGKTTTPESAGESGDAPAVRQTKRWKETSAKHAKKLVMSIEREVEAVYSHQDDDELEDELDFITLDHRSPEYSDSSSVNSETDTLCLAGKVPTTLRPKGASRCQGTSKRIHRRPHSDQDSDSTSSVEILRPRKKRCAASTRTPPRSGASDSVQLSL